MQEVPRGTIAPVYQSCINLTLPVPIPDEDEKLSWIKLSGTSKGFMKVSHTSLWCLKKFQEGLKGFHKTFWGTTKKCENKNLTFTDNEK